MSTAGHPDALMRRIEQLAASSADEPEGAALAALVGALRSEMSAVRADVSSVRAETAAVRADLDGLGGRLAGSVAAGRGETGELAHRVAELGGRLDGLGGRVEEVQRSLATGLERDTRASAEQGVALEDARGALEARLAVLEDVLDALSERIEALARDGAGTTTELLSSVLQGVRGVDRRVQDVDARAGALEDRLLSRLGDVLAERDQALREEVRSQLADLEGRLSATVAGATADLGATFSRSLADVAGEVDVAATTTRDASTRVAALAELGDLQRAEVERLLQVVQDRLVAVDAAVAEDAAATATVAQGLAEVAGATARLEETVGGFRAEWPTRTYEVVEGARAVAQGVVLDVREEVAARLEQVRAVLGAAVQEVEQARSGLDGGTDRLAEAGAVLVGYLEERDRLLEAERDRVLHDVLEAFAAGLSARERGALAGRVQDAVSRRRDARDAERYRTAVGEPVAPTVAVPDAVRRLVPPDAEQARAQAPAEPARPGSPGAAEDAPPAEPAPAAGPPRPAPRTAVRTVTAAARPAAARPAPGGSAVLPGPGKRVPAPGAAGRPRPAVTGALAAAARQASEQAPEATPDAGDPASPAAGQSPSAPGVGRGTSGRPADRRGRLDTMPEVPSVAVALDAAAPRAAGATSGEPAEEGVAPVAGPSED